MSRDKYQNFRELSQSERANVDYAIRFRRGALTILVAAPHGGAIEPGTSELAEAIAANDLSFYGFEGLKANGNEVLHITSTLFDEPQCIAMVAASDRVITVHGEGSSVLAVYLGGKDQVARHRLEGSLLARKFEVLHHMDPSLQGRDPSNICNRGKSAAGIQLELSRGLRKTFFSSLDKEGRKHPTERFMEFVAAVREAII